MDKLTKGKKVEKGRKNEKGKRRMKRSSWMLILIMAFLFTFAFDMLELWVLPFIDKALSK